MLPPNAVARPDGSHDAANGERFLAIGRLQRQAAADRQTVAVGQLVRNDERVRLREKDQRIVDDGLVAAVEVVVAQTAIAGHVDAEHEQVAFALQVRIHDRFDDGDRHAHRWRRPGPSRARLLRSRLRRR